MIVNFRRQISTNSWISSKMTWDMWTPSYSPLRNPTRGWAILSLLSLVSSLLSRSTSSISSSSDKRVAVFFFSTIILIMQGDFSLSFFAFTFHFHIPLLLLWFVFKKTNNSLNWSVAYGELPIMVKLRKFIGCSMFIVIIIISDKSFYFWNDFLKTNNSLEFIFLKMIMLVNHQWWRVYLPTS